MDRINSLPDDLLCHVLSFLPTKDAALTCVLSKRWLNLWKLVLNFDIDDSVFLHPEDGKGEREEIRQSFVDFVDSVLAMQGDSPIKNFSLKCITYVHPSIVKRWIRNVVQRGVLDLNLVTRYYYREIKYELTDLPIEMFLSSTLVKLKITSENWVILWHPRPRNVVSSFPMLKILDINSEFIYCGEIVKFIPSFPVLEELRMANVRWEKADVTVSSASLRKLSLHARGCLCRNGLWFQNLKSFSFDTPNLLFLDYSDLVAKDYPLVNMGKLVEARINLIVTGEDDDTVIHFGNVVKLMNGIQNVQRLTLSSETLEVLSLCTESIPVFNNLKFLGVASEEGRGWQATPVILRNCPHLETIIMEGLLHSVTDECGDACPCISREDKGRSLASCPVNRLEIQGFRATMKEMNMIKHFLDYFPCLKRLDVFIDENDHTHLRNREDKVITEMFDLYNKLSPSCSVQLLVSDFLDKKSNAP